MTEIRPTDDDWMGLADLARITGKSIETLYNERSRGEDFPKTYRFGGRVRFRRSHVDAWIERQGERARGAQLATAD